MNDLATLKDTLPALERNNQFSAAEADSQRAIAEVQGAIILAKRFPRDAEVALREIERECTRKELAEVATYEYAKGGTKIEGPSIRLAEALALSWGNIHSGWRELGRSTINGVPYAEIEAWAWDLEKNRRLPITFKVKLMRDTKTGSYLLKDEREIYEQCANQAKRRERAAILAVIPGWVQDRAMELCQATLKATVNPENTKKMLEEFQARFGVTRPQIEKFIQRNCDAIEAGQVVRLRQIFTSLKDGMSKSSEWFEVEEKATPAGKGTQGLKDALKAKIEPKDEQAAVVESNKGLEGAMQDLQKAVINAAENALPAEAGGTAAVATLRPFNLLDHKLTTQTGTKEAVKSLAYALESYPVADRSGAFVALGGLDILEVLGKHGLGGERKRFTDLGINLPPM